MKFVLSIFLILVFVKSGITQITEVDEPVKNFEKLWTTFDERYANFALKKVNWQQIHEKYRPLINEKTTNEQLFEVCCAMLQELNDGHVTIDPNFSESDIECSAPYDFQLEIAFENEGGFRAFETIMDANLLEYGFSSAKGDKITDETNFQYRVSESFGYLRLDEMTEKITFGKFKRTLDEAIKNFQDKKGIIVDLRFNGGGWDYNAYKLASKLLKKGSKVGHFERTKLKARNGYTPMKYRKIKAGGKYQFTKEIVILTSDFTASAAEVFLLAVKDLPYVTIIGEHTEGIFSDMYEFRLPNKWEVSLSHQQYFSSEKQNYEGEGIAPDFQVINSKNDLQTKTDPVIEMAIKHLTDK